MKSSTADEENDFARRLEFRAELFNCPRALNFSTCQVISRGRGVRALPTFGLVCKEMVDFGRGPIIGDDSEPYVVHIQYQNLTLVMLFRCDGLAT